MSVSGSLKTAPAAVLQLTGPMLGRAVATPGPHLAPLLGTVRSVKCRVQCSLVVLMRCRIFNCLHRHKVPVNTDHSGRQWFIWVITRWSQGDSLCCSHCRLQVMISPPGHLCSMGHWVQEGGKHPYGVSNINNDICKKREPSSFFGAKPKGW